MSPQEQIEQLQTNVTSLLHKYADLQQQVSVLIAANNAQHEELMKAHAEVVEMKKRYSDLQTAHVLTTDDIGKERAKRRITSLIARIDKAIFLLQADNQPTAS